MVEADLESAGKHPAGRASRAEAKDAALDAAPRRG